VARFMACQTHAHKRVLKAHRFLWVGNLAYLVFACLFAKTNVLNYGVERTALSKTIKMFLYSYTGLLSFVRYK